MAKPVLPCSTPACYPLKLLLESLVPKVVVLSARGAARCCRQWESFVKTAATHQF